MGLTSILSFTVASYMGAWIETNIPKDLIKEIESHPTWVRGLKQNGDVVQNNDWMSHPTWVRGLKHEEISGSPKHYQSRILHGCVD